MPLVGVNGRQGRICAGARACVELSHTGPGLTRPSL